MHSASSSVLSDSPNHGVDLGGGVVRSLPPTVRLHIHWKQNRSELENNGSLLFLQLCNIYRPCLSFCLQVWLRSWKMPPPSLTSSKVLWEALELSKMKSFISGCGTSVSVRTRYSVSDSMQISARLITWAPSSSPIHTFDSLFSCSCQCVSSCCSVYHTLEEVAAWQTGRKQTSGFFPVTTTRTTFSHDTSTPSVCIFLLCCSASYLGFN